MSAFYLHQIDPILASLGSLHLHWYGLMYVLGALGGEWLGKQRAKELWRGMDARAMESILIWAMVGVIAGGRIGYMFFYGWQELVRNPLNVLKVWEGGMSFHGGLLGVMLAMFLWSRRTQRHVFDVYDFIIPLVPLGLGLGRLGNFIGGELWGRVTQVPWAVIFPQALSPQPANQADLLAQYQAGLLDVQARHPSQLYQAFWEGVVLFALIWWFSRTQRPRYAVSGMFLLIYGIGRFAIEFLREPDAQIGFILLPWMSMGQLLCLPMIFGGTGLLVYAYRRPQV